MLSNPTTTALRLDPTNWPRDSIHLEVWKMGLLQVLVRVGEVHPAC